MELRLYSFVNFYLSSIQQGIQTGHAAVKLVRKYQPRTQAQTPEQVAWNTRCTLVDEWAEFHETFYVLNGGDLAKLKLIATAVAATDFPFAKFIESQDALGGMLTAVAVVLPEHIFDAKAGPVPALAGSQGACVSQESQETGPLEYFYFDEPAQGNASPNRRIYPASDPVFDFIKLLKSCPLAR